MKKILILIFILFFGFISMSFSNDNEISKYDKIIKEKSEIINWDWRLISSLIYHESKFNPDAISHKGAFGLMQLMPNTAKKYGVTINSSVENQIEAGIKLIEDLDNILKKHIKDDDERKKFVIAAYNIGIAHIYDSINLAKKYDKDHQSWDDVKFFLVSKSNPKYYNDDVVKYGKINGTSTKNFVNNVFDKYEDYIDYTE
jgi:membrane-bound lytic murein transglycosylase F